MRLYYNKNIINGFEFIYLAPYKGTRQTFQSLTTLLAPQQVSSVLKIFVTKEIKSSEEKVNCLKIFKVLTYKLFTPVQSHIQNLVYFNALNILALLVVG